MGLFVSNVKPRGIFLLGFIFLLLFVIASLPLYTISSAIRNGFVVWDAGSDPPEKLNDKRFYILLFPAQGTSIETNGRKYPLKRAVLVSLNEYQQKEIEIYYGNKIIKCKKGSLTVYPDLNTCKNYAKILNREIKKWGKDTDWRYVKYKAIENGKTMSVTITIKDKKGNYTVSVYDCNANGTIVPKLLRVHR